MASDVSSSYVVGPNDTLERIAAAHDLTVGELMKANRLSTRMVFEGQSLRLPVRTMQPFAASASSAQEASRKSSQDVHNPLLPRKSVEMRGPGVAVPAHHIISPTSSAAKQPPPPPSLPPQGARHLSASSSTSMVEDIDSDCLQRFLKVQVKQVTESEGTVPGTLLVTPNCLMFDPDVTHALVKENGQDVYGMVANLDDITSVTLFKDIGALLGEKTDKKQQGIVGSDHFPPERPTFTAAVPDDPEPEEEEEVEKEVEEITRKTRLASGGSSVDGGETLESSAFVDGGGQEYAGVHALPRASTESESQLLDAIEEEDHLQGFQQQQSSSVLHPPLPPLRQRTVSDDSQDSTSSNGGLREPPTNLSRFSPTNARRSFGKLSRTLSARARSVGTAAVAGGKQMADASRQVAHGVVTHTKSAAETLEKGLVVGAKVAVDGAKVVASMPANIVNSANTLLDPITDSRLYSEGNLSTSPTAAFRMKREQSLAKLQELQQQTLARKEEVTLAHKKQLLQQQQPPLFHCATNSADRPDVFRSMSDMLPPAEPFNIEPPYYLAVRLSRKRRKSKRDGSIGRPSDSPESAFGNKLKREFWYAVPRRRADAIYHFLLQWTPDKYGQVRRDGESRRGGEQATRPRRCNQHARVN